MTPEAKRHQRVSLSAVLRIETPLHVGSGESSRAVDLLLARDVSGRLFVPGSSLKGALRASAQVLNEALWGDSGELGASRITVHDAYFLEDEGGEAAALEVRQGVSISRFWGSAVDGMLYSREFVRAGQHLALAVEVELSDGLHSDVGECRCPVCVLVQRVRAGIQLGAGATAGNGVARLCGEPVVAVVDMSPQGMWDLLTADHMQEPHRHSCGGRIDVACEESYATRVRVPWRARGPVMSQVALSGSVADAVPLTRQVGGSVHLLLPGSSLKGSLRAQAEKIVRSISAQVAPDAQDAAPQMSASEQLASLAAASRLGAPRNEVEGGSELGPVGLLFGAASGSDADVGRKGALTVFDCLSARGFESEKWAKLMSEAGAKPAKDGTSERAAQNRSLDARARELGHVFAARVSVDRWTGATIPGALFSSLDPYLTEEGDWDPIVMNVDVDRLGPMRDAPLGLLWLVLRDLKQERFGFGFGQTRGYGAVEVAGEMADLWPFAEVEGIPEPDKLVSSLVSTIDRGTL